MPPLGNQGAAARKDLRVLLPFTSGCPRIPDELAAEVGAGAAEALVVGPYGDYVKVWHVEVRRDGDGALLGRGWPEFAAACGAGTGWFLILRHRGRGALTVKAFDSSYCLRELGAPAPPAVEATTTSSEAASKPQFITMLPQDFMKKMLIPAKFVQLYIPKEHLNSTAIIFGPLGKIFRIDLEMNRSDVFFASGWSQFISFHGITGANALLLRYEGGMVFTVKVFEPNGCLRGPKHKGNRLQQISILPGSEELQKTPSLFHRKHKSKNYQASNERPKNLNGSMTFLKKGSKAYCAYDVGPPAWMKRKVDTSMIEKHHLCLPRPFCNAIGFREPCMITLQTSVDSTRLWKVQGHPYKSGGCQLGSGWKSFCQDIKLKEGDVLTIDVIQTTLWRVDIARHKKNISQADNKHQETSSTAEGGKRPNGSMTYLNPDVVFLILDHRHG